MKGSLPLWCKSCERYGKDLKGYAITSVPISHFEESMTLTGRRKEAQAWYMLVFEKDQVQLEKFRRYQVKNQDMTGKHSNDGKKGLAEIALFLTLKVTFSQEPGGAFDSKRF